MTRSSNNVRPVRVLQIIDTLALGGAQALLPLLANNLDGRQFELEVCVLSNRAASPIPDRLREAGIPTTLWPRKRLLDFVRILQLVRLIRERKIDVIHAHLLYSSVQAPLAALLSRVPVLVTLHSTWSNEPPWSTPKRYLQLLALRLGHARVIAVADEIRRQYVAAGLPRDRITVVPNGIDLVPYRQVNPEDRERARAELLGDAAGPLLVSVGRIVEPKAYPDLVVCFAKVLEHFPEARLAIVGRLSGGTSALKAAIQHHGVEAQVILTGMRSDVPAILAASDLYVLSSTREGIPLVLLEAMAAGVPIVATRVGGVPEIIDEDETGVLVPSGQPLLLAEAVIAALADPERLRKMAVLGHERAERFSVETWSARLATEYRRALHPRNATDRTAPTQAE